MTAGQADGILPTATETGGFDYSRVPVARIASPSAWPAVKAGGNRGTILSRWQEKVLTFGIWGLTKLSWSLFFTLESCRVFSDSSHPAAAQCTLSVHSMYTQCTLSGLHNHAMYTECTRIVHSVYNENLSRPSGIIVCPIWDSL